MAFKSANESARCELDLADGLADAVSMMHEYLKAEISASAIRSNVAALRGRVLPGVKICVPVKCDAYGHGTDLLWPVLADVADWLAVVTPEEALHVRDLGYDGPLLVLFPSCMEHYELNVPAMVDELLQRRVTLTVVSPAEAQTLLGAAIRTGMDAKIHVKVDTGMTRSGVLPAEAAALIERIRREAHLRLTGVYTHLASAEEPDKTPTQEQLACFRWVLEACRIPKDGEIIRHTANSAGTIDLPEAHFDMVRPGLAVYGYQPGDRLRAVLPLRPAMRVTGHLMQIKAVPAGTRCGYNLTHEFRRDSRVGLVPIGYGDGYFRHLSGRATMRVGGRDVPVCGRVSMDQTIVDLTDAPEARVGDEVEIISNDPAAPHSAENLARLAGTIVHEVVTRLGRRVRRVLVE